MSHVGIFWFVPSDDAATSTILADMTPVAEASDYAGFKTHERGHYEFWTSLAQMGRKGLRARGLPQIIAEAEYETYPRGRVVFDPSKHLFMIYADRRLHRPEFINAVRTTFGIPPSASRVSGDQHYSGSKAVARFVS